MLGRWLSDLNFIITFASLHTSIYLMTILWFGCHYWNSLLAQPTPAPYQLTQTIQYDDTIIEPVSLFVLT